MSRGSFCRLLAGLLLAASGGSVHAQSVTRGPALNWVRLPGAEHCIAPVELAQRVEERLGRVVFVRASDAIVVVEGRVGPAAAGGFAVVLQVSDPDGTLYGSRELESPDPDCRMLDEVVALVIAVTLRRERTSAGGIALPEPIAAELDALFAADSPELDPSTLPPTAAAPTQALSMPVPVPVPVPDSPSTVHLDLDAGLSATTGLQPSLTLAPRMRARLLLAGLGSAGLEAALSLARDDEIEGAEEGSLHTSLWYAGAVACGPVWGSTRFELHVCLAARLGRVRVEAHAFLVTSDTRNELWFELGPELDARITFDPLYLQLTFGVPFRIVAPEFQYRNTAGADTAALSVARAGVHVGVGVGLRF